MRLKLYSCGPITKHMYMYRGVINIHQNILNAFFCIFFYHEIDKVCGSLSLPFHTCFNSITM